MELEFPLLFLIIILIYILNTPVIVQINYYEKQTYIQVHFTR